MIQGFRRWLGDEIRTGLSGSAETPTRPQTVDSPEGLFGPSSATRAVHGDPSMLVGGLRALLLQTLHPLAMAGVADHSTYRSDPLGRLHRTGHFIGVTTFGTRDEAEVAIDHVRRVHLKIEGTAPDGRRYEASDPHLLSWVHCTEVDSFLRARIRYGASTLPPTVPDRYVAEMASVASMLGVLDPPTSRLQLKTTLESFRPELYVGSQARSTVRFLALPPLAVISLPFYGVVFAAAASMLPGFARRMLRLPIVPLSEPTIIRPIATALLRSMGWALEPGQPARP